MKQFFRNFRKQKLVGLLSISSLSLGIMVSIIIGLWATNEMTFDNFHKNGKNMYRIVNHMDFNNIRVVAASSFKPLGELAEAEIPEISQMCRIYLEPDEGITINNIVIRGIRCLITDHNFFNFFSFPLKEGDINTVFAGPDNVIITESAAKKYFPNEDPIGKPLVSHGYNFHVSGIMYDFPNNSHIQAEMIFPFFKHYKTWEWDSSFSYCTYFIIQPGADIKSIEERISKINQTHALFLKDTYNEIKLEPLNEIHFSKTDSNFESAIKGDKTLLEIFILIALVILIIACINFTNLFISTSFIRAKAIGIKKSQGAERPSLILEFYKETALYVIISAIIGVILAAYSLPVFNEFTGSHTVIDPTAPLLYIFVGCVIIATTLLAGTFPALQMTRFGIIETLGNKFKGKRMAAFQKVLIVIQFSSSICLFTIVFFFSRQINHILSQDLGFAKDKVIYMHGWGKFGADFKSLRNEMIKHPSIQDVAIRRFRLPYEFSYGIGVKNMQTGEEIMLDLTDITPTYFDVLGMELVAGENPFTLDSDATLEYCVINERTAEILGLDDPVGANIQLIAIGGNYDNVTTTSVVRGVVRNSHTRSLRQGFDPQIYINLIHSQYNPILFKIAGDPRDAIKVIEEKWKEQVPDVPFEYHFLDDAYTALYKTEVSSRNVLMYALLVSFIITIAGLFAMAYYSTQKRAKEISIRKVNGASVTDLLILLNKDTVSWVIVSSFISAIIAYIFLKSWLDNFVVKTPLSWWVFILTGLVSCLIALLTVSVQTWKAANENPIKSIKNE